MNIRCQVLKLFDITVVMRTSCYNSLSAHRQFNQAYDPPDVQNAYNRKATRKKKRKKKDKALHFFLQLFSDEILGMCCHFVSLVTTNENWNFPFDHACLGQNIVQISITYKL